MKTKPSQHQQGRTALWFALAIGIGGAANWAWQHRDQLPGLQPVQSTPAVTSAVPVEIFTATWCGVCKVAKKSLDSLGIAYTEHVIDLSPQAEAEFGTLGTAGVPTLLVGDRKTMMVGYSEPGLIKMYREAGGTIGSMAGQTTEM